MGERLDRVPRCMGGWLDRVHVGQNDRGVGAWRTRAPDHGDRQTDRRRQITGTGRPLQRPRTPGTTGTDRQTDRPPQRPRAPGTTTTLDSLSAGSSCVASATPSSRTQQNMPAARTRARRGFRRPDPARPSTARCTCLCLSDRPSVRPSTSRCKRMCLSVHLRRRACPGLLPLGHAIQLLQRRGVQYRGAVAVHGLHAQQVLVQPGVAPGAQDLREHHLGRANRV
jgi:hypothetical protein